MENTKRTDVEIETGAKPSFFDKARNRLAMLMMAGSTMGCASTQPTLPLSVEQKVDLRDDVISELQRRKICQPFEIELGKGPVTRIGLSHVDNMLVDVLPSYDATIQNLLLCYPEALKSETHVLDLLRRDVRVIRFLSEEMLSSRGFMLKATQVDNRVLDYGRPALFENEAFMTEIILMDAKNIKYAFPYHLSNPKLFMKLMQVDLKIMDHLPKNVSSNVEFMEGVGYLDPRVYLFHDLNIYKDKKDRILGSTIWDEKEYAQMITDSDHLYNLQYFSPKIRSDVDFMLELMKKSPRAYHYRDYSVRGDERLMRAYLATKLTSEGRKTVNLKLAEINELIADMQALNIEFPDRFSIYDLRKVIETRKGFQAEVDAEKEKEKERRKNPFRKRDKSEEVEKPKKAPVTLQLAAKADWNGAFVNGITKDFLRTGNTILYFEINESNQAMDILDDFKRVDQTVNTLIISGHGSPTRIALGAPDPRLSRPSYSGKNYFDPSDRNQLVRRSNVLEDNSPIILESCSVGYGGIGGYNITNDLFRSAFPQAETFASRVPTSIERLIFQGKTVTNVLFASGPMTTFRGQPKAVIECLEKKGYAFNRSDLPVHTKNEDVAECRNKVFSTTSEPQRVVSSPQSPTPQAGNPR